MDGHGVVLENPILGDIVGIGYGAPLTMTLPAKEGDVHGGGRGGRIPARENVMAPVAVSTRRGKGVSPGCGLSVEGSTMLPALGGVAGGAVHGRHVHSSVGKGEILVAKGTTDSGGTMDRRTELVRGDQELCSPVRALEHGRIAMAHEAHLILSLCQQGPKRDGKSQEENAKYPLKLLLHRTSSRTARSVVPWSHRKGSSQTPWNT